MIKLLSKVFIKETDDSQALRRAYGFLCSGTGIALNVILFIIKFIAGTLSGAISVTADAFNNLSDSGSSLITMFGFRLAAKKPDPKHPFGHGRMEYLSGLVVSMLIILMGFELLMTSAKKIFNPEPVELGGIVFAILIVSVAVKLYMYSYNKKYGKIYNSAAMAATAADSLSDAVSTCVVLISMLITYFTNVNIDAYCGTAVAVFILYAGAKSAFETIQPLLGMSPDPETVKKIEEIVMGNSVIIGMHDLVVHDYGPGRLMISLHAEVPSDGDILIMHDEIDNTEMKLKRELQCEAVIHMDPIVINDPEINGLREQVHAICQEMDENVTMHDFRVVKGPTHTNLIFDVLVPMSYEKSDAEIAQYIRSKITEIDSTYFCVITVDKNYAQNPSDDV